LPLVHGFSRCQQQNRQILQTPSRDGVLAGLEPGQTLVPNFGLIEQFPTAFYSWLLKVRELVLARKARLVLCRHSAEQLEISELFRARPLFDIAPTEAQAVRDAGGCGDGVGAW
jgi:hypothetical protein